MSGLIFIGITVVLAATLIGLSWKSTFSVRSVNLPAVANSLSAKGQEAQLAQAVMGAIRKRNFAALGMAVIVLIVMVVIHQSFTAAGGLSLILAPMSVWICAVLVLIFWPIPNELNGGNLTGNQRVSADLTARTTGMFGPGWGIVVPVTLVSTLLAGVLIAGKLSATDERGRYRDLPFTGTQEFSTDPSQVDATPLVVEGRVGPFPGWYYGIPVGVLVLCALLLTLWALNKNVRRPAMRGDGLLKFDTAVRSHNGHVLSSGFSAMLCFQCVPLLFMAATSTYSAARNTFFATEQDYVSGANLQESYDLWQVSLAWSLGGLSLILLILGVVFLGHLAGRLISTFGERTHEHQAGLKA